MRTKNWVPTIALKSNFSTAWVEIPPTANLISARSEGTKWEITYELDGKRKTHFAGAQFTQSLAQINAFLA